MPKVILLQPNIGDWDGLRSHPSLPLSLLSAARRVANEFEVIFIDTRIDKNWKATLKLKLDENTICAGVTSMTGRQIGYALEISSFVKKISHVPVVWGGIHATILPESTLSNGNIDILVIGEGEVSFLELARALAAKGPLNGIPGVWYKDKGKIIRNTDRKFEHLDDLPQLPLSLINLNDFLPVFKGRRTFNIETSRGCPNQCRFCYNSAYNKNSWRAFSARRVINDFKYMHRNFNIGSFYVIDDNFFIDLKRSRAIAEGIIEEKMDIFWEVQGININSAIKMDDEYLGLLVKSGMKKVHFGVESASEKILKSVNKNLKVEDVVKINKAWSNHNIVIQYNFMCGFPEETIEDIRKTKDLVFQLMKDNRRTLISPICPYTPYPGTDLYDKSLEHGFIRKKSLEDWQQADYGDNLWESDEKKRMLSSLFFASMFLDRHRSKDMVESKMLKFLIELYRPLAKFRVKHLFFKLMPELKIKELIFR